LRLTNVVSKAKLFSSTFAHVDFRIYQDEVKKGIYFIEVSKGRCFRRVLVDGRTAENIRQGHTDVILLKEVRTALQFVTSQARESEVKAALIARRRSS
jgi:hypothetical protein